MTEPTVSEQATSLMLISARADLTAARARIAELDSMLDRSCSAYQDDIEKLSARIAELEDWQRRAVRCLCDDTVDCDCPVVDGCDWCRARNSLVEEATR